MDKWFSQEMAYNPKNQEITNHILYNHMVYTKYNTIFIKNQSLNHYTTCIHDCTCIITNIITTLTYKEFRTVYCCVGKHYHQI